MVNVKFKNSKKGQAAIEFLMTYGWMLLVVLIVGALIFSFVDFGSLLPNKVELNNNLRAHQTESYVKENSGDGYALVVFTYTGTPRIVVEVDPTTNTVVSEVDSTLVCNLSWLKNVNTGSWAQVGTNQTEAYGAPKSGISFEGEQANNDVVSFINGQQGIAEFWCSEDLLTDDVLEGKISLIFKDVKTEVPTPSSGSFRVTITE
jgi:hypothetical protein